MAAPPNRTPSGWDRALNVGTRGVGSLWVLQYPDHFAIEHVCDRSKGDRPEVEPTVVICAPALDDHEVTWPDDGAPTVSPSIRCPDCSLHGHVTAGVWSPEADDGVRPDS